MDFDAKLNFESFYGIDNDSLYEFLHSCINEIIEYQKVSYLRFRHIGWNKQEYEIIHNKIISLLHNPGSMLLDEEQMPLEYHEMPENVQVAIYECIKLRQKELTEALILKQSKKYCTTLYDFDWRLKYVTGSSKMASIKEPLVQLDLRLKKNQEEKILMLEMNKEELDKFLSTLKNVA